MFLQVVQVVLLLLLFGLCESVVYDGALICFKYEDDSECLTVVRRLTQITRLSGTLNDNITNTY